MLQKLCELSADSIDDLKRDPIFIFDVCGLNAFDKQLRLILRAQIGTKLPMDYASSPSDLRHQESSHAARQYGLARFPDSSHQRALSQNTKPRCS